MKITFDNAKRLTVEDDRFDYGEERFQTVGFLAGRMVMIGPRAAMRDM